MTHDRPKRKPGRPKAEESSQMMNQILRTAAFLFMEHGFEKVSLEQVAQACGVTKASVYYYYKNKSVLFTESLLFILKIAYDKTATILKGPGSLQERVIVVAQSHMRNAHVDFETMMREAALGLSEEQVAQIRSGEHAMHQILADVFQQAMDEGEIIRGDSMLLAYMFTATLTLRNRNDIINEHKSVEQIATEIVQLLWKGWLPRPDNSSEY